MIEKGKILLIAGRPGTGKTKLAKEMAAKSGLSWAYFTDRFDMVDVVAKAGIEIIILDYLQLLNDFSILKRLRTLAEKENTAIVLISQVKRTADKSPNKIPTELDIIDYEYIAPFIDNIFFTYVPD